MTVAIITQLKKVRDFRTKQGQRHRLWLVLVLVIMGTMSGCVGYRGNERFCQTPSTIINRNTRDTKR
ncbi:transposase family protein [Nostoc piscinale]|uniref:transposase family protein n=1 Tax=Nostoc piscinale TaxID=224012 RepID=UPI0009F9F06B